MTEPAKKYIEPDRDPRESDPRRDLVARREAIARGVAEDSRKDPEAYARDAEVPAGGE